MDSICLCWQNYLWYICLAWVLRIFLVSWDSPLKKPCCFAPYLIFSISSSFSVSFLSNSALSWESSSWKRRVLLSSCSKAPWNRKHQELAGQESLFFYFFKSQTAAQRWSLHAFLPIPNSTVSSLPLSLVKGMSSLQCIYLPSDETWQLENWAASSSEDKLSNRAQLTKKIP